MARSRLDLLFLPPEGDYVGPPIAHVYVKSSGTGDYKPPYADFRLITPQAFSIDEFEGYIDRLQKELEEIRKEAREKYAAYDK